MTSIPVSRQLPPYVFALIDSLKAKVKHLPDFIDLGMGNPDLPPPTHVMAALSEAAQNPAAYRYSVSRGITELRQALMQWYDERYGVTLDPEKQIITTIGAKEGLAHLPLALTEPGDQVLVPAPCYPIHRFAFELVGAKVAQYDCWVGTDILANIQHALENSHPKPRLLLLSFPSNPTAVCVTKEFFEEIIALAKYHQVWVLHDFAYADIVFDGYRAPSILEVSGAEDIAVEVTSLSKTYSMPGCRVGFMAGNAELIGALKQLKSYLDYGIFEPIQRAAVAALTGPQDYTIALRQRYQDRRDVLCRALNRIGWDVAPPKGSMFLWAPIPKAFVEMGSLKFMQHILEHAHVALSPGIGFGEAGDQHVRFSLLEDGPVIDKMADKLQAALAQTPVSA